MTYKAPKTIAAEEIKMTKLSLGHIFVLGVTFVGPRRQTWQNQAGSPIRSRLLRQTNQAKAVCPSRSIVHGDYRVARTAFLVAGKRVTSDPGLSSPAETGILGGCRPTVKHSLGDVDIAAAISGRDGQK